MSTDPRENKRKIVNRLKYGQDKKTTAQLRTEDGCLCFQGVIADEYLKEHGQEWVGYGGFPVLHTGYDTVKTAWVPTYVREWSGFTRLELNRYTSLNDDETLDLSLSQLGRIIDNDMVWGV